MSHKETFYPVVSWRSSRLTAQPIKSGPSILARCGHLTYQQSHIMRGLGAKRVTPVRFSPLYLLLMTSLPGWLTARFRPTKCTDCEYAELLAKSTVCAWCYGLIMPGERVCLYTHLAVYPSDDLEQATRVVNHDAKQHYVCCDSLNCHAGYGGAIVGHWTGTGVLVQNPGTNL